MQIEVVVQGLSTTIQDLGRPGHYHLGIPEGGALDRYSARAANLLVGNDEGAALLEATFTGPTIKFSDRRVVAVTGAELPPKVDGAPRETWTAFVVEPGQTLSFDFVRAGSRAYIAISGGIDVPVVMGSRATTPLSAIGGLEGRALRAGDVLRLLPGADQPGRVAVLPEPLRSAPPPAVTELRMVPGLYWHRVTEAAGARFLEETWKVATEADRVAFRLKGGQPVEFVEREQPFGAGSDPSNVVDCGYPYGSIQMPSGTQPIILHRDAVSGGGYFMLGTVISADMDLLGQLQPNQQIRFRAVDIDEAVAARHALAARTRALRAAFGL